MKPSQYPVYLVVSSRRNNIFASRGRGNIRLLLSCILKDKKLISAAAADRLQPTKQTTYTDMPRMQKTTYTGECRRQCMQKLCKVQNTTYTDMARLRKTRYRDILKVKKMTYILCDIAEDNLCRKGSEDNQHIHLEGLEDNLSRNSAMVLKTNYTVIPQGAVD